MKKIRKKRARTEEQRKMLVTALLAPSIEEVAQVPKYQEARNRLFELQGIPTPHPKICQDCLQGLMGLNESLVDLVAFDEEGHNKLEEWLRTGDEILINRLSELEHTYRTQEMEGSPEYARGIAPLQMVRAHIMLDALENQYFIDEIGKVIEENPKDWKTELGGLIVADLVRMRAGLYDLPATEQNKSFSWSISQLKRVPHIATYHLHALDENCTQYAGPSNGDMENSHKFGWCTGEAHGVVFTKLDGKRFNVDYYSSQRFVRGGRLHLSETILDLGNYDY